MLTLAAVGRFFIPIRFGHLVPHTSYTTGWIFLAAISFVFALVGLMGHTPVTRSAPRRASLDGTPVDGTPVDGTPVDGTPVDGRHVATRSSSADAVQ
jgi:hypothetical protein